MKNTSRKILVVAFMLGTLIGYANENKTSFDDAKKVRVVFNSVKKGQTITLKNNNGNTIYNQEILNAGKYSRIFNLAALENGTYTAELNKNYEVIVKPFTVKEGTISFKTTEEYTIFKPVIRTENNLLYITKINLNEEPVKVSLYYENEVIYTNTFTETPVVNKVFRFLENESGNYRVVINGDNKSFVEEFKI